VLVELLDSDESVDVERLDVLSSAAGAPAPPSQNATSEKYPAPALDS